MAEKSVTVIPARRRVGNTVNQEQKPKLRVCAYCRVSTDSDEQATSYEAQVEHYTTFIQRNAEWEFAGIFADDGISGTNTKKREEFNRMIEECMAGHIDMIITKSISRFARNTLDCLQYIRELKDKNIPVFFEKENINTMDSKGEVQVNHNRFLGYTKDEDGHLIVESKEAEVVKRIYREYLEGASLKQIGEGLEADGILTAAKKKKWRPETLKKILQNEKYIGDALLQKTYTVDFLTKKRVKNNGIVPQYYVENSHEAIIPRDLYMQVQEAVVNAINQALGNRDSILMALEQNITEVITESDSSTTQAIEEKLRALQKELLKLANEKKDYTEVVDEIDRLRQQKQDALVEKADWEGLKQRIEEIKNPIVRKPNVTIGFSH